MNEKTERFNRHGGQTSNVYHVRPVTDAARLPGEQVPTAGVTRADDKELVLKKQSLKKESPSPEVPAIHELFEAEIGRLSPWVELELTQAMATTSPDIIIHAIEQAAAANVRKWQYVKAVIDRLHSKGLVTREQIMHHEATRMVRPDRVKSRQLSVLPAWVETERAQQQLYEQERRAALQASVPEEAELTDLLAQLI